MYPIDDGWRSGLRRALLLTLFWAGLLLCAVAIARYWDESRNLLHSIGALGLAGVVLAMVAAWALAVASWQQVVVAHDGRAIRYAVAARHLALLLLGKYLPGGIWGFVARLSDSATQRPLAPMFAAGVCEQWLGLVSMSLLAGIGLSAAHAEQPGWVLLGVLIPVPAVFSLALLYWFLQRFSRLLPARWHLLAGVQMPSSRLLFNAAILTVLQQALVLMMVALVAASAFALDASVALAVASSFGLAVVAGIAVVFMPGGILVREAVFVWLASQWLTPAQAIALAAGLRLLFTAFDLLAGALAGGLHLRKI